ncbi:MAG: TetR/AcrR family transcriptional regulator [Chloroflexota bacterium]|nr:MAG: TetR/AcrR family transcriptional regulator [Chloroflexota bacterium]
MRKKALSENASEPSTGPELQKKRIVTIAARLFARNGYAGTSVDDIAAEMGATKGTVYHYFRSKQTLLYQAYVMSQVPLIANLREIVAADDPPDQKFRKLIRTQIAILQADPSVTSLLVASQQLNGEFALPPAHRRVIRRNRKEYRQLIESILNDGIEKGVFRPVDVPVVTKIIIAGYGWLVNWFKPRGRLGIDEVCDVITDFFMSSLLARPTATGLDDRQLVGTASDAL